MEAICGMKCSVKEHSFYNECKGMIYVYNNEIIDVESIKEGLREEYSVANVEQANWIKPRQNGAKAYVLTCQRETLPSYNKIIGEYSLTKVFE